AHGPSGMVDVVVVVVGVVLLVVGITVLNVSEHSACCPRLSVAMKVMTELWTAPPSGVHEKSTEAGEPLVNGRLGLRVAPAGSPATLSVICWPSSGSAACTVKRVGFPNASAIVEPQAGVGASKAGGEPMFGVSWMRKSTATLLL